MDMGLSAQYVDGELIQKSQQNTTTAKETKGPSSDLDKDAFLQLLVAQMKYQDPLEPTSNTEYISQYATFSELEQMQNMSGNMTLSRASETVGKEVIIETTSESGNTKTVQGYVEKVVYNGNKAYLSIDGALYSIDDLKQVIDEDYLDGTNAVEAIETVLAKLPKPENVTLNDVSNILDAYTIYSSLTDYQASLLSADTKDKLDQYVSRANDLIAALKEQVSDGIDEETLDELMKDQDAEEV